MFSLSSPATTYSPDSVAGLCAIAFNLSGRFSAAAVADDALLGLVPPIHPRSRLELDADDESVVITARTCLSGSSAPGARERERFRAELETLEFVAGDVAVVAAVVERNH